MLNLTFSFRKNVCLGAPYFPSCQHGNSTNIDIFSKIDKKNYGCVCKFELTLQYPLLR